MRARHIHTQIHIHTHDAGPEYRSKVELMEAISRALPVQDRGDGSSEWFCVSVPVPVPVQDRGHGSSEWSCLIVPVPV